MRKITGLLLLLCLLSTAVFSQEKKNRFGLKVDGSLNWMKPDNEKKYQNDGVVARFGYGFVIEFGMGDNAAFVAGFGVNGDGGKIAFRASDQVKYFTLEDEFVPSSDSVGADAYLLKTRTYKNQYVTVPLILKMKSNEIGAMTYFGQFGLLNSFNFRADVDDVVIDAINNEIENTDLDNEKDIQFLNMGLVFGGGAEFGLSGSTSFVAGLNVVPGFLNVVKKNSRYLVSKGEVVEQKANSMNISLVLGFLF